MKVASVRSMREGPPAEPVFYSGPLGRSVRLSAAVLLMLVCASLGTVSAQDPTAGGITVSIEEQSGTVSIEDPSRFTVRVGNTAEPTGTPLDQPRQVTLSVSGAPDGWTASLSPATVSLLPGDEKTVALQVAVSVDAQDESATLTVTASAQGSGVPLVGEGSSDDVTIDLERTETASRSILESIGDWIWLLLLALLAALLVVARLLLDRRRMPVRLTCHTPDIDAEPGEIVEVPVEVQNLTRGRDSITLYVATTTERWDASPDEPELSLDGGQLGTVKVRVRVPARAEAGQKGTVMISARSVQSPGKQPMVTVRVHVVAASRGKKQ